ncbi:MAG: hypothetical protein AB9856_14940 [Cellulosilyticaceae bacterium]
MEKKGNKKSKLKLTIIILAVLIGSIIIGGTFIIYKVGDYAYDAIFKSMMMGQVKQTLGIAEINEELSEEQLQKLDKILGSENLMIEEDGTEQQKSNISQDQQSQEGPSNGKSSTIPEHKKSNRKVTKKELEKAVEKRIDTIMASIPTKDKNAMINLVIKNISHGDLRYLIGLVVDGISEEDLANAKQIALKDFTPEQLEEVKGYYDKYSKLVIQ